MISCSPKKKRCKWIFFKMQIIEPKFEFIPKSVERIEKEAFYGSTLRSLTFNPPNLSNIETIEEAMREYFDFLPVKTSQEYDSSTLEEYVTSEEGVTSDDDDTLPYRGPRFKSLRFNSNIEEIGNNSFEFAQLSGYFPSSSGSLGMFFDSSIRRVVFMPMPKLTLIGAHAFMYTPLRSIAFPPTLNIIEEEAFSGCSELDSVFIPSSVTWIKEEAFSSSGVSDVHFSSNSELMRIERGAFQDCVNLDTINLPSSVRDIGRNVFRDCRALKSVYVSAHSDVDPSTFYGCHKLDHPYFDVRPDHDEYEDDHCYWRW